MKKIYTLFAAIAALLLLSACSASTPESAPEETAASVAGIAQTPEPSPTPEPEPTAAIPSCLPLTVANIGELSQVVQIGQGEPHDVLFSPDGEMIALASGSGLHLFDGRSLERIATFLSGYTSDAVWSADSSLIAVSSESGGNDQIQLWDVQTEELILSIDQERSISTIWIDGENGKLLALGQQKTGTDRYGVPSYCAYLDTYRFTDGKRESSVSFKADDGNLMNMSLSPGGQVVFGAGLEELYFWNFSGKLLYSAPVSSPMYALGVSNGTLAAILDLTQPDHLQIIDLSSKQEIANITIDARAGKMDMDAVAEKLRLYTSEGYVIYDLATQQKEESIVFPENLSGSKRISNDLTRLVQLDDGQLNLVEVSSGATLGTQDGFVERAWQVAVGSDCLAAGKGSVWDGDTRLMLWDLNTLEETTTIDSPEFSATITDLCFLPGEESLLSFALGEDTVKFWNAADGSSEGSMSFQSKAYSIALSGDGTTLAVGFGGFIEIWPLKGDAATRQFAMNSFVTNVSISQDGSRVAACDGSLLVVWDAAKNLDLFGFYDDAAVAPVLSPDGRYVAISYFDGDTYSVSTYNVDSGAELWNFSMGENYQHMCYSPDGSMLAISAYADGLIFLNAENGEAINTLEYNTSDFSFSGNGELIATASSDGSIRVWGVVG